MPPVNAPAIPFTGAVTIGCIANFMHAISWVRLPGLRLRWRKTGGNMGLPIKRGIERIPGG
ncbi:MAG TPA: hypothetical protein VGC16_02920, partial [Rhizomicrobium sp.]